MSRPTGWLAGRGRNDRKIGCQQCCAADAAFEEVPSVNRNPLLGNVNAFGSALIAYSLNMDETTIKAIADGTAEPPANKAELLGELVQTLTTIRVSAALDNHSALLHLPNLMVADERGQHTIFNGWRLRSGGSIPAFQTGDSVVDALAPLAAEVYPLVLAAAFVRHPGESIFLVRPPLGHPSEKRFEEAVLADEDLSRLFPQHSPDGISTSTKIIANTGRGGGVQLATFSNLVLNSAYVLMRMRLQLGADEFRTAISEVTEIIRQAARGEATSVPAWIGVGNVAIPDEVELPWGMLRPYPYPTELELVPMEARPSVAGEEQTVLGMILETSYEYRIDIGAELNYEEPFEWPGDMEEQRSRLDQRFGLASLAFVLAVDRTPPVACTRLWNLVFDPLSLGSGVSWNPNSHPSVSFHIVSEGECKRVGEWAKTLDLIKARKMEISQRRILSAITDRSNPVDGFVDVVIAWENIFAGTSQGELSFRICAAMSKLLSSDESERLAKHKELVDLYNKRSKVVHGSQDLGSSDAMKYRDAALDALVRSLRRLYSDYPELLDDTDRSKKIILTL